VRQEPDVREGRHRAGEVSDEPPEPGASEPKKDDSEPKREARRARLGKGAKAAGQAVDVEVDADSDADSEQKKSHDWLDRLDVRIGIVAAVIGIVASIVTLYYTVFPHPGPCPGTRAGTLGAPTVDTGVSYRQFLQITGQPPGGADKATLDRIGTVIDLPFVAEGYQGKELPMRWSTLTAGGVPLTEPGQTDQLALEIIPEDCSDRGRRKLWAPWPSGAGRYVVEVTWLDEDEELLDTRRTAPFGVPPQ
jgi:hypothetical protein